MISLLLKLKLASDENAAIKIILGVIVFCVVVSVLILYLTLRPAKIKDTPRFQVQVQQQPVH